MKKVLLRSLAVAIMATFTVVSCDKKDSFDDGNGSSVDTTSQTNDTTNTGNGVDTTGTGGDTTDVKDTSANESGMPEDWVVELPSSIKKQGGNRAVNVQDTLIDGGDYYKMMTEFIDLAEGAAGLVSDIIGGISAYNINQAMTVTFTGEDGRTKTLVVTEDVDYDTETWGLFAEVKDEDGSTALQVFWNDGVARGVAILSPYDMNHLVAEELKDALYKVYYSGLSGDYDEMMEVSVMTGLPADRFAVDHMKMFVGRKGTAFELYGNSNHPDVYLLDPSFEGGRNWAFIGKAEGTEDIAVAATCLPPSDVATNDNIIEDYAFKKVILEEAPYLLDSLGLLIFNTPEAVEFLVDQYSVNLGQPAFFVKGEGFVGTETAPNNAGFTADFIDLGDLKPYVPKSVRDLSFSFK